MIPITIGDFTTTHVEETFSLERSRSLALMAAVGAGKAIVAHCVTDGFGGTTAAAQLDDDASTSAAIS